MAGPLRMLRVRYLTSATARPTYSLARRRPAERPPARHCLLPSLSSVPSVPRRPHFVAAVHILASFTIPISMC
jgi:hypothetical protein